MKASGSLAALGFGWVRGLGLGLGLALTPMLAHAAAKPPGWDFPGAELLIGAGTAVVLVLLGRALAAPARRADDAHGKPTDA